VSPQRALASRAKARSGLGASLSVADFAGELVMWSTILCAQRRTLPEHGTVLSHEGVSRVVRVVARGGSRVY
jgi:hypothetical protein